MVKGRKRSGSEEENGDKEAERIDQDHSEPPRKIPRYSNASDPESDGDFGESAAPTSRDNALVRMPKYRDILLGRGRGIQSSNGNYLMREIARKHRDKYTSLRRDHRREYSEAVLDEIYESGARFLKRVETTEGEMWEEVERSVAHDKVSHALRDRPPENASRRPGLPVGTGNATDSHMFQDPVSGKMYHIANAANLTSASQIAGPTTSQGQRPPAPTVSAAMAAPALAGSYPSLGGMGLQNQLLQSLIYPFPLQSTGIGLPGVGNHHGSSGFGGFGGGGELGATSAPSLPTLLTTLASMVQQHPSLGGLIQQVLLPEMAQTQPDVQGNMTVPRGISGPPPAGDSSSSLMNNLRNLVSQNLAWSAASAGAPNESALLNQRLQQDARDANFSLISGTVATESRQEPSILDHHDIRLGINMPDISQNLQQQSLAGSGQIFNSSQPVPGLQGTDYAYAVMQALMAARPLPDSSTGSDPHDQTHSSERSGGQG